MKQAELSYNRKRQLADSLKMLMVKKNLKKITVQEIADGCGAIGILFITTSRTFTIY